MKSIAVNGRAIAKTILVVEDDPIDLIIISEALKRIDPHLNIQVERNGVDAVLYLKGEAKFADRKTYPIPDVILLDLNLPLFDGSEFLDWLHKRHSAMRHIPVVVVSGNNRPEDIEKAYGLGASAVIIKSSDWNHFKRDLAGVTRFWSGRRRINSHSEHMSRHETQKTTKHS